MFQFLLLLIVQHASDINSVTVRRISGSSDISHSNTGHIIKDLDQVFISCKLNDVIIIDVPIIEDRDTTYTLHRPNGDITKLNITLQSQSVHNYDLSDKYNEILTDNKDNGTYEKVSFIVKPVRINAVRKYEVFNLNEDNSTRDIFAEKQRLMKGNEFMIGPLDGSDNGNWVLRCVYEDEGKTIVLDQVIVIHIIETVPANQNQVSLRSGDKFMPQFLYPIEDIDTCELVVPQSAVDKWYDRNRDENMKSCGYVVPNVTREDSGIWGLVGVGRIVYSAKIWLVVT